MKYFTWKPKYFLLLLFGNYKKNIEAENCAYHYIFPFFVSHHQTRNTVYINVRVWCSISKNKIVVLTNDFCLLKKITETYNNGIPSRCCLQSPVRFGNLGKVCQKMSLFHKKYKKGKLTKSKWNYLLKKKLLLRLYALVKWTT